MFLIRLYLSRKEGERKLAGFENRVDASVQGLEVYIKKKQRKTN